MKKWNNIAVFIITALLFSGCKLVRGPALVPPGDVTASSALIDQIDLAWTEVADANIYYIYRSDTVEGEYSYHGFTYAGTYTDTDIAPEVPYWYKVTASDIETNNESERSSPVVGDSNHEYAWSQAIAAGTGAAQQRLAVDTAQSSLSERDIAPAYLAYSANDETGAITVSKYDPDEGTFTVLGGAFGTTDGSKPRIFDIAVYGGSVYLAYSDKGLGGKVTVKTYTAATGTWQTVGSEGFSEGIDARYLSIDLDSTTGTVYLGYISSDGVEQGGFKIHNSSDLFATATDVPDTAGLDSNDTSGLVSFDGTSVYHAFEDDSAGGIISGVQTVESGNNLRDGYMDFIAVSGSQMYIAYYTDAFHLKAFNGSDWTTEITPSGASAAVSAASTALAYYDGNPTDSIVGDLYLFYSDDGGGFSAAGLVKRYNTAGWVVLPGSEDAESITTGPTDLDVATYRNIVYASYLTAGVAQMRVWE